MEKQAPSKSSALRQQKNGDLEAVVPVVDTIGEKGPPGERGIETGEDPSGLKDIDSNLPTEDAQRGVQQAEAITLVWTKKSLALAFFLMWMLYFVNAMQSTVISTLTPFVTSAFEAHSLLTVIGIVASAMTAAVYIPLAKMLDMWGRAEGFLIMIVFAIVGLIIMAAGNSLYSYCAAQVFYTIGFGGMTYTIDVITADASQLKSRALAYAFTSSPYIITAFAGSKAADDFYYQVSWRWGIGCFAIILPGVALPMYATLKFNLRKAEKQGLLKSKSSGRTLIQSIWHHLVEFDILGVVLLTIGLTVFLLPFTLAATAPKGWGSGYIIGMLVTGFVVLVLFGLQQTYLAPVPFIPYHLLTDRTVVGACLLDMTYQISYYCWNDYFTSFLMVVNDLSVADAGYINNTFNIVSGVLLLGVGWMIRRTGRFKWTLYIGVPLYVFTQGLMIYFRKPDQSYGYLVMCQVLISIGGSIFICVEQLAILAAVDHQHVAAALALLYVVGGIGDAIGNTISGAIWTNTFEKALERNLPQSALANLTDIYNDIDVQLSYPVGTPTRIAIQKSYGYAQTRMLAAGTAVMALGFAWMLLIKNINVATIKQTKGTVF